MPKIAYLTPLYFADEPYHGGGGRYPTNLARGVARASGGDYQVELIAFGSSPSRHELASGVSLRVLPSAKETMNPLDVLSWDLPDALADADLVHFHQVDTRSTEVGLLVAKTLRKPICVTGHGAKTSLIGRHYGITDLADRIVCNADFVASFFQGRTPVEVIRGGVDSDAFTVSKSVIARSHILYVGRFLSHRGIDRLIRALPSDMPLVVCGRPCRADYFDLLRDLAQGKNVRFVTEADENVILDLYRKAWATVLPSIHIDCYGDYDPLSERMDFSLLESMACGTPIIGSNLADMTELVRDGQTGFVFDSVDELRDQLEFLASTPSLVARMGEEARRSIDIEFSLDVAGGKLARLYNRLLSSRGEREAAA